VIDANLPGLRVDTVAGDDVINSIEHGQNLIVTGSSDGLTAGTALTVTVNGKTYAAPCWRTAPGVRRSRRRRARWQHGHRDRCRPEQRGQPGFHQPRCDGGSGDRCHQH
jgi:hypothetical protein